jgi:hypothetical protein
LEKNDERLAKKKKEEFMNIFTSNFTVDAEKIRARSRSAFQEAINSQVKLHEDTLIDALKFFYAAANIASNKAARELLIVARYDLRVMAKNAGSENTKLVQAAIDELKLHENEKFNAYFTKMADSMYEYTQVEIGSNETASICQQVTHQTDKKYFEVFLQVCTQNPNVNFGFNQQDIKKIPVFDDRFRLIDRTSSLNERCKRRNIKAPTLTQNNFLSLNYDSTTLKLPPMAFSLEGTGELIYFALEFKNGKYIVRRDELSWLTDDEFGRWDSLQFTASVYMNDRLVPNALNNFNLEGNQALLEILGTRRDTMRVLFETYLLQNGFNVKIYTENLNSIETMIFNLKYNVWDTYPPRDWVKYYYDKTKFKV